MTISKLPEPPEAYLLSAPMADCLRSMALHMLIAIDEILWATRTEAASDQEPGEIVTFWETAERLRTILTNHQEKDLF